MAQSPSSPQNPQNQNSYPDDFFEESSGQDSAAKTKRIFIEILGRWYWIALGIALGLLASLYYLSKAPKLYSATSTLLVKQSFGSVLSKGGPEATGTIDLRSIEGLNTFAERLQRPELLERVAARQDVRQLPGLMPSTVDWLPAWMPGKPVVETTASDKAMVPPPAGLAGMINGWLSISVRKGTRLLDVSIMHENPDVAKSLADAIAQEYIAELTGNRTEGRTTTTDLLVKESEQARANLQAAESALASYRRALDIHTALETKEFEVRDLARRYREKHPRMMTANGQLMSLESRFMEEFNAARRSKLDQPFWQSNATELEAVANDADELLKTARRLLVSRASVLQSEVTSQTSVFNSILTRIQESDINQQAPDAEVELSSSARKPTSPSSPNAPRVIAAGLAFGFFVGFLIALLFRTLDNKFHTVAQVEAETNLSVLAAISDMPPRVIAAVSKKAARKMKKENSTPNPAKERWNQNLVFREGVSDTRFAEMYRVLRTSVSLLGNEKIRKVTLFTSALPGEGKTTVSANFALAAAQQGRKTLIIDLDLRKPALHKAFGVKRDATGIGITQVLAQQGTLHDAICHDSGEPNLDIIFSGVRAPNPGELLNSERLKAILEEASRHYDVIVLDTAPLLPVPDTRLIAPLVANLCLVVRGEYVPKGAVRRTVELLASAGTPPSGIVFNGFVERKMLIGDNYSYGNYKTNRYGKSYRYGQYGTYGSDED